MPSLKVAQALLTPETQNVLSLPTAVLILGAVSQAETVMEIVDRVCDPLFRSAGKAVSPASASACQNYGPSRLS